MMFAKSEDSDAADNPFRIAQRRACQGIVPCAAPEFMKEIKLQPARNKRKQLLKL